jgi:hypothetical protein
MTRLARALALAGTLTLAVPPGALAGTFDIFGHTPRDVGMGNAMTAAVVGFSALHYNPAALTAERTHSLGLNLRLTAPALHADRRDPLTGAFGPDPATVSPGTHVGFSFGWVKPFGGIFDTFASRTGGWGGAVTMLMALVAVGGAIVVRRSPALGATLLYISGSIGFLACGGIWLIPGVIILIAANLALWAITDPFRDGPVGARN